MDAEPASGRIERKRLSIGEKYSRSLSPVRWATAKGMLDLQSAQQSSPAQSLAAMYPSH